MEVGENSTDTVAKSDGLATPTPMDPLRGLPQLFRSRGFSSDFSEDGEATGTGSRRNSLSDGQTMGGVNGGRTGGNVARASTPGVKEDNVFAGRDVGDRSLTSPTACSAETRSKKADLLVTSPVTPVVSSAHGFTSSGSGKEAFLFPTIKPFSVQLQDIRGKRKPSPKVFSSGDATSPVANSDTPSEGQALVSNLDAASVEVGLVSVVDDPTPLPAAVMDSPPFLTPSPPVSRHTSPEMQQTTPIVSCSSSSSSEEEELIDRATDVEEDEVGTSIALGIKSKVAAKEIKVMEEKEMKVEEETCVEVVRSKDVAEHTLESLASSEEEMEDDEDMEEQADGSGEVKEEVVKKEHTKVMFDAEGRAGEEEHEEEGGDLLGPVSSSDEELEEEKENDEADKEIDKDEEERLEEEEEEEEEEEDEEEDDEEEVEGKVVEGSNRDMANIALEQMLSEEDEEENNEEKGRVLGFDQELLPERLSFSPAPPPVLSLSAPPTRDYEEAEIETTEADNNVLEEVATLESGMGGVFPDEVHNSSLGFSADKDSVLSSSSGSSLAESEDSKVEKKSSVPYLPSPLRSSVRGHRTRGQQRHRNISHLGVQPPSGGSLPCSPLVVHVKRHMVPSLRSPTVKEEEEEFEDTETSSGFGALASSRLKTKAEIKAEQFVPATPYQVSPMLQTPSSSPTPPPSPPTSHAPPLHRLSLLTQDAKVGRC